MKTDHKKTLKIECWISLVKIDVSWEWNLKTQTSFLILCWWQNTYFSMAYIKKKGQTLLHRNKTWEKKYYRHLNIILISNALFWKKSVLFLSGLCFKLCVCVCVWCVCVCVCVCVYVCVCMCMYCVNTGSKIGIWQLSLKSVFRPL